MKSTTVSYLILILSVLFFLFLVGCKSKNDPIIEIQKEKQIEKSPSELETIRKSLLDLHNKERSNKKIEELKLDDNLCEYAQNHSKEMLSKNKLKHSNIKNVGAKFVAENVAYGQETCEEVTKAWMNSYFHKINILSKKYKKVGFGYVKKDGKIYWCTVFTN
jgi:uncharacterized protein YkwD